MSCQEATTRVTKLRVTKWKLDELKDHPLQKKVYPDLPDLELERLAQDIKLNGLNHPIDVTPDGVIICGHQRVKAARLLGRSEIRARVRDDLDAKGEAAIQEFLINDNLNRRQLDPLGVARAYTALKDAAQNLSQAKCKVYHIDVRDRLAAQFNMSGRNLDRYARLLRTPIEVQVAVSANKLTCNAGNKVAGLKPDVQEKIAAEILAGKDPEGVVAQYVKKGNGKHKKVTHAQNAAVRGLQTILDDLHGRESEIKSITKEEAAVLTQMQEVLDKILTNAKVYGPAAAKAAQHAAIEERFEELN